MDIFGFVAWQFWLFAAIILLVLEVVVPGFFLACFGLGAMLALLPAILGLGPIWQVLFFAIGSLLSLWVLRPLFVRPNQGVRTGVEALLGRRVYVRDTIAPDRHGSVAVDGDVWPATGLSPERIEAGTLVEIRGYDSLVLSVVRVNHQEIDTDGEPHNIE